MIKKRQKSLSITQNQKERFLKLISQFKEARVLVVGDFILDQFIWGSVGRISPEAPVPVVDVNRESVMPGGALNVANNVHALKGIVYPCGVVGRDAYGRLLAKTIRAEDINTGGVVYDEARPTAVKTRVIAHSQQVVRFDREKSDEISARDRKKIIEFVKKQIKSIDVIVIEDYGKGVVTPPLIQQIVTIAKKYKKPVLVDPKEKHFTYYTGVTVITPNRKEAFTSFVATSQRKEPTVEALGKAMVKKLKCESVLITLGEDGMALFEKGGSVTRIPTLAQEVFDVSGAGDTVMAVFSLAVAVGAKLKEAALLSNLAASIVVGKLGTATVSPKELSDAVRKYTVSNGTAKRKKNK